MIKLKNQMLRNIIISLKLVKDYISLWSFKYTNIILGKNPTDHYLDEMMNCAPGPINFTMFLTMFGQKLQGTDPEDVIKNAFACFDEGSSGNTTN